MQCKFVKIIMSVAVKASSKWLVASSKTPFSEALLATRH
jgi:hypothetical protein